MVVKQKKSYDACVIISVCRHRTAGSGRVYAAGR